MKSISERALDAVVAALIGTTGVGDRVFRSRVQAVTRDETPCIVVLPGAEEVSVLGRAVDDCRFIVHVEITTRGDPYDAIADPIEVEAHARMKASAGLSALVDSFRKKEKSYDAQEADLTVGCVNVKYELRYLSAADDPTVLV
jgi:hypothetical protein